MQMPAHKSSSRPLRRRVRRWAGWLFFLGGLAVAGKLGLPRLVARKPLDVKAARVERGTVRDVVTSSSAGEVAPERHATVRAEIGARVGVVKFRRGDRVHHGALVVALDDADLAARLAQARAALPAQLAQIDQAKARVATLERQAQRAQLLVERGAGAAQASEDAANLLREAKEALRAQAGLVEQSQAAVRVAQVALEKTRLTAPFDGLLAELYPDPGEEMTPATPAFEIIDDSRLHVNATVDEADAARVALGQYAELTLDALPGVRIPGRLSRVAPALRKDPKGSRTLGIEVEVKDAREALAAGLKPGMSANVEVVVVEKPDVVYLPTNVIIGRGLKRTVYRVDGGVAHQVAVEVGLGNWERTEILRGVQPGDRVVSSLSVKGLEDGAPIRIEP
jgi:HlyD family secretion protein